MSRRPYLITVQYFVATVTTIIVLFLANYLGDFREVAQGALIGISIVAFLPILVVLSVLLAAFSLAILIAIVVVVTGVDIDLDLDVGYLPLSLFVLYYRWIFSISNPIIVGIVSGLVVFTASIWLYLVGIIIPLEQSNAADLVSLQKDLESYKKQHATYPQPIDGQLLFSENIVKDSFGREVIYETKNGRLFGSYRIRSLGYDGVRSSDDICVEGRTKLSGVLSVSIKIFDVFASSDQTSKKSTTVQRLKALESLRCGF